MPTERKIYALEGLKPEVKAVTFAKCSRSPESFAEIAAELTDEKSAQFHEKWVVGYGHSSVAEHAILSLAVENVSILATKIIEDNRLASYTEKSTRYQIFDRNCYYKPAKIMASPLGPLYEKTLDGVFDTYAALQEPMTDFIIKKYPKQPEESEKLYAVVNKARVCDNLRYLLPVATLTNLGMTINARSLEHAIVKFLSHSLEEIKEIGAEMKEQGLKITPTLIKFANENNYLKELPVITEKWAKEFLSVTPEPALAVEIVSFDPEAEEKIVAALLYPAANLPYKQMLAQVKKMEKSEREKFIDEVLSKRGPYDEPPRELEHLYYTFDILMDYGAFRDIQRHRMCTQTSQSLSVIHGYDTPLEIVEAGLEKPYKEAMEKSTELYQKMCSDFPQEAQYAVLLAFRKRTLFTWNLRELHHFISLRSGLKGHISYRRVAQACWQKINELHPVLAKYIRVNMADGSSSWASTMFNLEYNFMPKKD
ncbi:MAG: FAD-dependent thymidylate synthase [bacterium]|nr:FAD-dependent thymidylate synthase [bacterium]